MGAQWLSGRVLDSRPKGRGFEPHRRHCIVSLSKNINPSLVLVQPRKTRPFITERLLMGRKELNQTNIKRYTVLKPNFWSFEWPLKAGSTVFLLNVAEKRQTMLFSATQTRKLEDLARVSLKKEPMYVGVDDQKDMATVEGLEQVIHEPYNTISETQP